MSDHPTPASPIKRPAAPSASPQGEPAAHPPAPADASSGQSVTVFIAPNRVPRPAAPELASEPPRPEPVAPVKPAASAPAPAAPTSNEQAASFASTLTAKAAPPPPTNQQKCGTCGHLNRVGVLICENCGTSLISAAATILGTQKLTKDQVEAAVSPDTKLKTAEVNALLAAGADFFDDTMLLRLEIDGSPTPILVYPKAETSLGRRDPAGGTMPEVDLTSYAAYRLGVSRRHALLRQSDHHLQLVDLGSSNGTTVNGVRLAPHQPRTLRDGDEVMLGKMSLRVIFQKNARR